MSESLISTTLETLRNNITVLSAQHNEIKNELNGMAHTLKRLDVGLLGDVNLNHEGLFVQVKNQCIKHEKLEARVTIIENLKNTEDVLSKYKKGLFSVIFLNAGVAILWVVEKILTFVHIN